MRCVDCKRDDITSMISIDGGRPLCIWCLGKRADKAVPQTARESAMTLAQREVFNVIETFTQAQGFPPTVREIGELVGRKESTVHAHLNALKRLGLVTWVPTSPRTLRITRPA